MADMIKLSVSVTERQASWIRAEAKRRDVPEGEVVRGFLQFCIDAAAGKVAMSATVITVPLSPKTA